MYKRSIIKMSELYPSPEPLNQDITYFSLETEKNKKIIYERVDELLKDDIKFNLLLEECKNSLSYPLADIKREKHITDLSEYYGKWVKGWTDDPGWLNYGLIYNYEIIEGEENKFPETIKFLKSLKEPIFMAGYSLLKGKSGIPVSRDEENNSNLINVYNIGLIVPEKCFMRINKDVYKHEAKKFLSFSDSFYHSEFNGSEQDRLLLYIKF